MSTHTLQWHNAHIACSIYMKDVKIYKVENMKITDYTKQFTVTTNKEKNSGRGNIIRFHENQLFFR